MKKLFLNLLLLPILCSSQNGPNLIFNNKVIIGRGTTILTVICDDSIVMVADSRQTFKLPNGEILIDTVQKIRTYGDICFAFTNLGTIKDLYGTVLFDIDEFFLKILKTNPPFNLIATELTRKLNIEMHKLIKYVSLGQMVKDSILLQLSIVRFNKNIPENITGDMIIVPRKGGDFSVAFIDVSNKSSFFCQGHFIIINKFLDSHPSWGSNKNLYYQLTELIKMEVRKNPIEINCPLQGLLIKPKHYFKPYPTINICN